MPFYNHYYNMALQDYSARPSSSMWLSETCTRQLVTRCNRILACLGKNYFLSQSAMCPCFKVSVARCVCVFSRRHANLRLTPRAPLLPNISDACILVQVKWKDNLHTDHPDLSRDWPANIRGRRRPRVRWEIGHPAVPKVE